MARPARPLEVIRHARTDRLLASFEENIWSQRFRCSGCQSPAGKENTRLVAEHGEQVAWLKDTAEATMRYLITTENINLKQPERSRLLLEPLNESKHDGGEKMLAGDLTYKAFRTWLDDYAGTVNDPYASAADLPSRKSTLKLLRLPDDFDGGMVLPLPGQRLEPRLEPGLGFAEHGPAHRRQRWHGVIEVQPLASLGEAVVAQPPDPHSTVGDDQRTRRLAQPAPQRRGVELFAQAFNARAGGDESALADHRPAAVCVRWSRRKTVPVLIQCHRSGSWPCRRSAALWPHASRSRMC